MNVVLVGITLALATVSEAQTCNQGSVASANPLGTCGGCEDQFFMSQDCMTGFACQTSNSPLDGCLLSCAEGEHIFVNITTREWECVDSTTSVCPGSVEFFCPDQSIPTEVDQVECGCTWQVHVGEDCTEAVICHEALSGGKMDIKCAEGQTLEMDYVNRRWICKTGNYCPPNMGGVVFGCPALPPPVPEGSTEANCTYTTNNIGECGGCNQQFFINEDCDQAFYCSTSAMAEGEEGCSKQCGEGEVVSMDLYNRVWECIEPNSEYVCTGQLNTLCPDDEFTVQCECAGEVWMTPDCQELYICDAAMDSNVFTGEKFTCPEGDMVVLDIANGNPFDYTCVDRTLQTSCPGAFHYGCNGDLTPTSTTPGSSSSTSSAQGPDPELTTTTMTGGANSLTFGTYLIFVCLLMASNL